MAGQELELEQKLMSERQHEVTPAELSKADAKRSAQRQLARRVDAAMRELHRRLYRKVSA